VPGTYGADLRPGVVGVGPPPSALAALIRRA